MKVLSPRTRQITTPASHHSPDALPDAQPCKSTEDKLLCLSIKSLFVVICMVSVLL